MSFPSKEELSRAMLEEGLRHLEDARILHDAGRFPAAMTSTMKASELSFKAILILEGVFGWWENVVTSHSPITDASNHIVLQHSVSRLPQPLIGTLKEMERLSPARLGKKAFSNQDETNTEYPYVSVQKKDVLLRKPSEDFTEPGDSRRYYEAVTELQSQINALYPIVAHWSLTLPKELA